MITIRIPFFLLISSIALTAQAQSLTISQAVQQALDKYPAVRASLEQVRSADAGINLARTNYLPRADFLGQINRATRNNVFGLLLPQPLLPSMSGPVLGTNNGTTVWGSAVGALVSWEPFDFGLRRAEVKLAEAVRQVREADLAVTQFQVGTAAADAFLTILAAQQTTLAAQASVDRARTLDQVVEALVRSQLRPGVDAARAGAELALAETQLIQAEQATKVARASLAQLLGVPPATVSVEAGPLLNLPSEPPQTRNLAQNPLAVEQRGAVDEAKAREKVLDRSYFPTFHLQGAAYGRGTGALTNGSTAGGVGGLGPNFGNWALGVSVYFPAFDLFSIRAKQQIEAHQTQSETARYERVMRDLNGQVERTRAQLEGARRVAEQTPVELEAARGAEQQETARYRAGLGTLLDVADAQRLLTQAEIDNSLAKLNIWRSLLAVAAAQGDLQPFLSQTGK